MRKQEVDLKVVYPRLELQLSAVRWHRMDVYSCSGSAHGTDIAAGAQSPGGFMAVQPCCCLHRPGRGCTVVAAEAEQLLAARLLSRRQLRPMQWQQ